jgi:hypothetical protein
VSWLRLLLPFITRGMHAAKVERLEDRIAFLEGQIVEKSGQIVYWRSRSERLMDAALARAGAIHEPTMVGPKPAPPVSAAALLTSAFGITEIESGRT